MPKNRKPTVLIHSQRRGVIPSFFWAERTEEGDEAVAIGRRLIAFLAEDFPGHCKSFRKFRPLKKNAIRHDTPRGQS